MLPAARILRESSRVLTVQVVEQHLGIGFWAPVGLWVWFWEVCRQAGGYLSTAGLLYCADLMKFHYVPVFGGAVRLEWPRGKAVERVL